MPTMTHTDSQRKAWHDGKRRTSEARSTWFRRVILKGNLKGGYTPARFRLYYKRLVE